MMIKKWLGLFLLILLCVGCSVTTSNEQQYLPFKNQLANPGGEQGLTGWAASGGTLTRATAQARSGSASIGWDASADTQTLSTTVKAIPAGNGACLAEFFYYGFGTADIRLYVKDNSANVIGGYTSADTTWVISTAVTAWTRVQIPFSCPASGTTVNIVLEAKGDVAQGYVDDGYLGRDFRIGNQSTPALVASGYFLGTTNCSSWSRTSTTVGAFSSDADCPGPTVEYSPGLLGSLQTTDADLPKFTINNLPPGEYEVGFAGAIGINTSSQVINLAVNDGTTTSVGIMPGMVASTGTGTTYHIIGRFSYTTTANRTFELYGASAANTITLESGGSTPPRNTYFYVRRWPQAADAVMRGDMTDLVAEARTAGTTNCTWASTSGSLAAYSADTDCPSPTLIGNASAPGTKIPAVVVNNLLPGKYLVQATGLFQTGASSSVTARCTWGFNDGTTTKGAGSGIQSVTTYVDAISEVSAIYEYSTKQSSVTFQVYAKLQGGNGTCNIATSIADGDFAIRVIPLSQALPRPFIPGSVFDGRSGVTKIGLASITGSTGAEATDPSGMVSSGSVSGTSVYTINFTSGYFSSAPLCFVTPNQDSAAASTVAISTNPTTSSFQYTTRNGAGTLATRDAYILCIGNN